MKKIVLLSMLICMSALTLSAQETDEAPKAGIHVSGTSYYVFGTSSPEILGNVSVGYNFFNGWGVSANGYLSNMAKQDKMYGGSFDVYYDSMRDNKLYLIPSVGVGVLDIENTVKVTGNMAVKLHYNIGRTLFSEFKTKAMLSKNMNLFLIGITIGVNF